MRHRKHNHLLGVKKQHRKALVSNLCAALIKHGRIRTTLAKAKAIRPAVEKMITRAKKAKSSDDPRVSLHHRRQCARHLRDKEAAHLLFNEKVDEFINRPGGYVRIYKLGQVRLGDSAEMALVELVRGDDEGYAKRRKKKSPTKSSKSQAQEEARKQSEPEKLSDEEVTEEKDEVVAGEEPESSETDEVSNDEQTSATENELDREGEDIGSVEDNGLEEKTAPESTDSEDSEGEEGDQTTESAEEKKP